MYITTLEKTKLEVVYKTFVEAFSDYKVPISMTLEKFIEMDKTRDIHYEYSVGCFEGNQLVGFILCGYREYAGTKYCYDAGTGIIEPFRGKGIGNEMVKYLRSLFKKNNIQKFVLEVIEDNEPAIALYKNQGFKVTRRLNCFRADKKEILEPDNLEAEVCHDAVQYFSLDPNPFMLYKPSWQNDIHSIKNVWDRYAYVSLMDQGKVLAFGWIHKENGDIPQIGIAKEVEGQEIEIERAMIHLLKQETKSEKISMINVEENVSLVSDLKTMGFKNFVTQYEMEMDLF